MEALPPLNGQLPSVDLDEARYQLQIQHLDQLSSIPLTQQPPASDSDSLTVSWPHITVAILKYWTKRNFPSIQDAVANRMLLCIQLYTIARLQHT